MSACGRTWRALSRTMVEIPPARTARRVTVDGEKRVRVRLGPRPHLAETHRYRATFSSQSFQTGTTFTVPTLTTDFRDLSYQTSSIPSRTHSIIRGQPKPPPLTPRIHAYSSSPIPLSLHIEEYPWITSLIPFSEFSDHPKDQIFSRITQNPQDKTNTTIEFISLYSSSTMIYSPIPVSSHVTIQVQIDQLSLIPVSKTWPSPQFAPETPPPQTVFGNLPDYTSPFGIGPASLISTLLIPDTSHAPSHPHAH